MRLIVPIVLNCVLSVLLYLLSKHTSFKKLPYALKQIIIGILFGGVSAFASAYGVEWLGTVVNVRDAAPLCAGLIFGAPAGIISGFIGGLYRWFSVYWGAGTYTQLACTLATIFAGFLAAGTRKILFDNKTASWGYGVCIAVVCEVIHMMFIFLTNMIDSSHAFEFVKGASVPMILGNAIAVGVSLIIITILSRERVFHKKGKERIAQTFQRWLLVCIVVAYSVTTVFTIILQNGIVKIETQKVFTSAISDVTADVRGKSDVYMLDIVENIKDRYENDPSVSLTELAEEFEVMEINIVNDNGYITDSTEEAYIYSYNMYDSEQSEAFMILTEGRESFVQEYGPIGINNAILRKYAGMSLEGGGFIQVGYSADQFHKMLDAFVIDVTKNRHVGSNGFIVVCDENMNFVADGASNGDHISTIGIIPNNDMANKESTKKLCSDVIENIATGKKEEYIYAFTFAEGYCILAAMPVAEAMFMRDASLYNSAFMQVIIFATLFLFIYILIKKVIINNLQKINTTLSKITEGNLEVSVDVRSNAEFASLSDDINSTVSTLKRYIADAEARIDKELEYAKQIQLSALPTDFPNNDEFRIYAQMIAAKEVGGDFYDFYKLSDSTVAFLVADVSGKGIPAAMFMMTAKTIIKDLAESGLPVDEIFTRANEKLCENNESGMFVTAWMGILDLKTGKLQYANAGHNPPIIKHDNGDFEYLRSRTGFILAGMDGINYRVNELYLKPNDRIFLYTDGVTEATNINSELYGEDNLLAFMNINSKVLATELLPALKNNIDEFVGEAPQFDDITMLIFDYMPQREETGKVKVFPAKIEELDNVLGFIEDTLSLYDCPMKVQTAICVAIEELFVNVAHYAYGEAGGDVVFNISFDEATRNITFTMSDKGIPFDPLKKEDPDITLSAEDREIGGLGIFISKKTMDTITYNYKNGENILTMIKKI